MRKGNISHYTYELDFRDCSQGFCGVVVPPGNNNAFKIRELAFFLDVFNFHKQDVNW